MNQPTQEFLDNLIGKTHDEVIRLCKDNFDLRLDRKDKDHFVGTCDLRFDRINIEIDNNIITKADIG